MNPGGENGYQVLVEGWQACTLPGASIAVPEDLPPAHGAPWISAPALGTAASILRASGRWSLDAPARDFDGEDWWFRRLITLPAGQGTARLGLDGLATLADVWLDDKPVLHSENMFLAHVLELPLQAEPQSLTLTICCRALEPALNRRRPRPRWRTPMVQHQQLRWWRTTLIGRTPGWTPPVAPVGPWRPVWLQLPGPLRLRSLQRTAQVAGPDACFEVRASFDGSGVPGAEARLTLQRDGQSWQTRAALAVSGSLGEVTLAVHIPDPELWWPHTHGTPALYTVTLDVSTASGHRHSVELAPTGFRTISLDAGDDEFRILVNGAPVFCRGACWTPPDPVTLSAGQEECLGLLAEVRALGMNMVRLSGALVYENEAFFRACDAQGVLVWQDLMFANMDYPLSDPEFAAGATIEAQQQLGRLGSHPCLAVVCGNSEVEQQAAMWGVTRDLWQHPFFAQVLPQVCRATCPGIPYWPSSAHGGAFPHQVDTGTTSYYGVGAYLRGLDDARRSSLRFATECLAFANVPEDATIERMPGGRTLRVHHPGWKQRNCRDLNAGWDFEDVRDHYLMILFGVDPTRVRQVDHERYLQLSRVASGEAMAASFGEWRRRGSTCGGALVWFLRDFWAGAGWGLLDERGTRKASAWILGRRLQPTALWISDEGSSGLHVQLAHDGALALNGRLVARSWSSEGSLLWQGECACELPARSARTIPLAALCDRFEDFSWSFRFGPRAHAAIAVHLEVAGEVISGDLFLPGPAAVEPRADSGLTVVWAPAEDGFRLRATTRLALRHVHFLDTNFDAPEQYFVLLPDRPLEWHLPAGSCRDGGSPRGLVSATGLTHAASIMKAASDHA